MPPMLEAWDLAIEPFTARSRLYSLAPVRIGTVFVESLSGYVERLVAAHKQRDTGAEKNNGKGRFSLFSRN